MLHKLEGESCTEIDIAMTHQGCVCGVLWHTACSVTVFVTCDKRGEQSGTMRSYDLRVTGLRQLALRPGRHHGCQVQLLHQPARLLPMCESPGVEGSWLMAHLGRPCPEPYRVGWPMLPIATQSSTGALYTMTGSKACE